MKRLVNDYDKAQDVLSEARDQIDKGFEDRKEVQEALAAKNGVLL